MISLMQRNLLLLLKDQCLRNSLERYWSHSCHPQANKLVTMLINLRMCKTMWPQETHYINVLSRSHN